MVKQKNKTLPFYAYIESVTFGFTEPCLTKPDGAMSLCSKCSTLTSFTDENGVPFCNIHLRRML